MSSLPASDSISDKAEDLNSEIIINPSSPNHDINDYISDKRPFYKVPHLRYLSFCIFLTTLTSTNNGYDGSMLNGLQSMTRWAAYFGHPTGYVLGALSNGVTFGILLSFPIAPFLADRYGRKFVIILGQSLNVLGLILQGASTNYAFFLVSRIIIGAGSGIATVGSPTLISEISHPNHREVSTFSYNVCWYLGAIIPAGVSLGTIKIESNACWRIVSYLQAAIPVFQLALFWMVPESPRFLIARGKRDKAEQVLRKYHTGNSDDPRDIALVQYELNEIEAAIAFERKNSNVKYTDFIKKPGFRKIIFLVMFTGVIMQLSGNGLVSYYLNKVLNSIGITDERKQLQINVCLMVYNFVICCCVCLTAGYFKRRTLFITCVSGMLLTYIIWTVLSAVNQERNFADKSLGSGVLAMIFFYYLFYNIGVNGLPFLYVTEILPYSHRAKGMNIFQFTQTVVQIYNGFVNPIAMDAIEWKYYIVYCCILVVELIVVLLFYVETSGCTLEEVALIFNISPDLNGVINSGVINNGDVNLENQIIANDNDNEDFMSDKKISSQHVEHV